MLFCINGCPADMFIFHNIPLHYHLSMEKVNNFLQATGKIKGEVEMRAQCFCFHSFGLLDNHWATPTVTPLTFSFPSGISAPELVNAHLYCHGSNWQVWKSQPTRSVASPTVRVLAFVDRHLVIGDSRKCNLRKWVPATLRLCRLLIPVTFIRKCQRLANGIPWFQLSQCCSSKYEQAVLMCHPASTFNKIRSK